MCLAIYKPAGKEIPEHFLREGFRSNPHGAGFAFSENNTITIRKGYFSIGRFLENYIAVCHLPMLVHFRLATHGRQDRNNCHPFLIKSSRSAVVHNGIINIQSTQDLSDTGHFVKLVLEPIAKAGMLNHPATKYLVEQAVGSFNKIAVLNADGSHLIFNEDQGHWLDGVWYSNKGYLPSRWYLDDYKCEWEKEMMDMDYATRSKPKHNGKDKGGDPIDDYEYTINKIMRLEQCSRLDAEYMVEQGWPWDYDAIREV